MSRKTEKIEIDGHSYNITQLGAVEGRRLVVKLSKALAPVLGDVAKHDKVTETAIISALGTGLESLDEALVEQLSTSFGKQTLLHYQERWLQLEDRFDDHFAGRYGAMFKLLLAHLRLNFADFLDGKSITGALSAIKAGTTGSPNQTPTPTSGESS